MFIILCTILWDFRILKFILKSIVRVAIAVTFIYFCQISYFNSFVVARSFSIEHLTDRYESLLNEWYENTAGRKHERAQEKILMHQDCSSKIRKTQEMKKWKVHIEYKIMESEKQTKQRNSTSFHTPCISQLIIQQKINTHLGLN